MPDPKPFLSAADPAPVDIVPGRSGWLLTVEHAGRCVPAALDGLGLPDGEIDRHIGWDPGAEPLARALGALLDATLILQPYSRLVIDCNRPWDAPDLVPEVSDGTSVPANAGLPEADRKARWAAIHQPFHRAVADHCETRAVRGLVAVHSYDPRRRGDPAPRPWPVGLLWRQDNPLADGLAVALGQVADARPLGLNRPYEIEDGSDYTIPVHAETRRLPHVLIEVRNDRLADAAAVRAMADLLSTALSALEP
ncbi:MAG: N-formylglutamate amidohydrolase [Inquilinaceae bacterium]